MPPGKPGWYTELTAADLSGVRGFRLLGQLGKSCRVLHRDVGQNLAIELDAGLLQPTDEAAVADAVLVGGGVDAHDPQRAVLALLLLAAGVGELEGALDRLFCGAVEFGLSEEKSGGPV